MNFEITMQPERPNPEKIAKILWHELSAHDSSQYTAIEEDFQRHYPNLNVKKMINEFKHGNSHCVDMWCKCGIGKRYKHNGDFEWLAGKDKECTCTIYLTQVPASDNERLDSVR